MQRAADEGSDETQILSAREKETQPTPEIRTQYLQTCGVTAGKEPTTAKSFWRIKLLKSRIFEGLELSPDLERNLKQVIISQVKFFQLNTTDGVLKPELIWELTWVEQRQEEVPFVWGFYLNTSVKYFCVVVYLLWDREHGSSLFMLFECRKTFPVDCTVELICGFPLLSVCWGFLKVHMSGFFCLT